MSNHCPIPAASAPFPEQARPQNETYIDGGSRPDCKTFIQPLTFGDEGGHRLGQLCSVCSDTKGRQEVELGLHAFGRL